MNVNNKINALIKLLIKHHAHKEVKKDAVLAGRIIAAKLYRDRLLTNSASATNESISSKTQKRLKLIQNDEVKSGFTGGLKLIINALSLDYTQKLDKVNQLNALLGMDLKAEDIVTAPESPRAPQSFEIPRARVPQDFESAEPLPLPESPAPSRISRENVKKVSFDERAPKVHEYLAEFDSDSVAESDEAGAYVNEGYTPDLDELPSSSKQFDFPKAKYTPESDVQPHLPEVDYPSESEELPPLPVVDYESDSDDLPSLPEVDYASDSEDSARAQTPNTPEVSGYDGGPYNPLTVPGNEHKPYGRLVTDIAQDQYTNNRSFNLTVLLSEQEMDGLPIAAGLRALIQEKEKNSNSSARVLLLSSQNKSGERWIFTGRKGSNYAFRKIIFNTEASVNK